MTQFGLLLGALVVISASSLYFAVRYYREARRGDPGRVYELETELAELKSAYSELKSQAPASAPLAETKVEPVVSAPTVAAPPVAAPVASTLPATVEATPVATDWLSKLLPTLMPSPDSVAIRLQNMKTWVSNGQIRVRGAFQYTRTDNGAQTGRFLIVAKGQGETIWVHPKAAWNPPSDTTIAASRGESFSVGRFREIRADFGTVAYKKAVEEVRIMVFDRDGRQLIAQVIPVTSAPPKPVTAAPSTSSPSATTGEPVSGTP